MTKMTALNRAAVVESATVLQAQPTLLPQYGFSPLQSTMKPGTYFEVLVEVLIQLQDCCNVATPAAQHSTARHSQCRSDWNASHMRLAPMISHMHTRNEPTVQHATWMESQVPLHPHPIVTIASSLEKQATLVHTMHAPSVPTPCVDTHSSLFNFQHTCSSSWARTKL
jgi:hypothetical protein